MINHVLSNGLRIIILPNEKAPLVNVTLGYKVGSKDDSFSHKGFAHFFEHLMFDGSKHVKRGEFDALCSKAGGTFNAYTSYDQTMYHTTVPSHQLDLVLWLESDRMLQFGVEQIGLETQQKVVSEEIKQSVENQPYGTWRVEQGRLAFTDDCSYQWEVLGNRSHIESATLDEVASFFDAYYRPDNACLVISGHVDVSTVLKSVERYFGIIPSKKQTIKRNQFVNHMKRTGQIVVQDAVPLPAVFVSYHLDGFMSDTSVQADILASAFGDGKSSRLYSHLVRDQHIASSVFCYADQREHASLLTCSATAAHPGISHQQLLDALDKEIQGLLAEPFSDTELEKAINAAGTGYAYHMQTNAGIADMVCNQTLFWNDPMRAFSIVDRYRAVTKNEMNGLIEGMIRGKESCTVSIIPS
ncbi:MAG: M16 family metallopeptidase [Bacteroidota bacterium]